MGKNTNIQMRAQVVIQISWPYCTKVKLHKALSRLQSEQVEKSVTKTSASGRPKILSNATKHIILAAKYSLRGQGLHSITIQLNVRNERVSIKTICKKHEPTNVNCT